LKPSFEFFDPGCVPEFVTTEQSGRSYARFEGDLPGGVAPHQAQTMTTLDG
jgi:hypothetical protein